MSDGGRDRVEERRGLVLVDTKVAIAGGAIAAFMAFGGMYALGQIGVGEAHQLLESHLVTDEEEAVGKEAAEG